MTHFRYYVQAAIASVPIETRCIVWIFLKRLTGYAAGCSIIMIVTVLGFEALAFI